MPNFFYFCSVRILDWHRYLHIGCTMSYSTNRLKMSSVQPALLIIVIERNGKDAA